jgi:peptidoglycan-associated lipoprotein
MNRSDRNHVWYLLIVLLLGIVALWGCPKKADVTATPEPQREEAPTAQQAPAEQAEKPVEEKAAAAAAGLQTVYFDFDESAIRSEAREIMISNAEWLKAHPQAKIRIEGNCDERGTIEYNQALGQRRASAAKKYLTDLGISASRISLISYGKEKPGCTESTESCWQKNRRDDFTVVSE